MQAIHALVHSMEQQITTLPDPPPVIKRPTTVPQNAILYFKALAKYHGAQIRLEEFLDPGDGSTTPVIALYTKDPAKLRRAIREDIRLWWLDKPERDFAVSIKHVDHMKYENHP